LIRHAANKKHERREQFYSAGALPKGLSASRRRAHHERNQKITDHPEPVDEFKRRFLNKLRGLVFADMKSR